MQQPEPIGQMFVDWAPRPDRVVKIKWCPRMVVFRLERPLTTYDPSNFFESRVSEAELQVQLFTAPVSEPWREGLDGDWLCQVWDKQGYAFDPVDRVLYATPYERKVRVRKIEGTENITVPWLG